MRKLLIGVAALVALAIPAIALAQNPAPVVSNDVSITPSKAGTSKKPAAAKFTFKVTNSACEQDHGQADRAGPAQGREARRHEARQVHAPTS